MDHSLIGTSKTRDQGENDELLSKRQNLLAEPWRRHHLTTSSRPLTRFRWYPFLVVICFAVTTAFSTTYPVNTRINRNGLPSKPSNSAAVKAATSDKVVEEKTQTKAGENSVQKKIPSSTNIIPVPVKESPKNKEDKQTPTNDTEEEDKEKTKAEGDSKMEPVDDQKFKERIQSSIRTVQNWENVEWLKDCREVIPWEDLRNATGPHSRPDQDRLLADNADAIFLQRLCRWFPKFMSWVNSPPCVQCGCTECEMKTVRGPETEEEKEGSAKRVEGKPTPQEKIFLDSF